MNKICLMKDTVKAKRLLARLLAVCMVITALAWKMPGMIAMASDNLEIELCANEGSITGENGIFTVKDGDNVKGTVTVRVDNADYKGSDLRIAVTDSASPVVITLESADSTLQGIVRTGGNNPAVPAAVVNGDTAVYTIDISDYSGNFIAFNIGFENKNPGGNQGGEPQDPGNGGGGPGNMVVADLIINGTEFKDVTMGSTLAVGKDFDFSKQEITVTRLKIGANETTYTAEDHFGTGYMVDQDGTRDAFSLNGRYEGANFLKYGLEFHGDHPGNTKGFPSFYIPSFKLVKPDFRGLVVKTAHVMDMIDFGSFNEVDLGEQKRGEILAYYGDDVITLEMDAWNTQTITNIEALGLPRGAVTIDPENKTVTVNSNYYDEVPLAVTLSDGKTNDFVIKRLGIEMHLYAPDDPDKINDERPLHGASGWGANFPDEYQSQYKLGAVFYHDRAFGYEDFQLVATLTYRDGTTETKVVDSYGERIPGAEEHESEMAARGCDYILWSGSARADAPVLASVTAVRKGALTLGSNFGGCTFGSGAGVEWKED